MQNLLRRMLEKDPDHRISLPAAISHPWVTVEGSVRSEALSITEEPGTSGGGEVQVGLLYVFVRLCVFTHQAMYRGSDLSPRMCVSVISS